MLARGLTVRVSVGIGATNPMTRLSQLKMGADLLSNLFGPSLASGLKFDEVCSVVFGALGQADGKRFFVEGFDPHKAAMELEQSKQQSPYVDPHKLEETQLKAEADLHKTQMQTDSAERIAAMHYGGDPNQADAAKLSEAELKAAAQLRLEAIKTAGHERVASIKYEQELAYG
jgi:hypothetical protein